MYNYNISKMDSCLVVLLLFHQSSMHSNWLPAEDHELNECKQDIRFHHFKKILYFTKYIRSASILTFTKMQN